MQCVSSLIKTDRSVSVRQAAALFTYQLLQGLGIDSLKVSFLLHRLLLEARANSKIVIYNVVRVNTRSVFEVLTTGAFAGARYGVEGPVSGAEAGEPDGKRRHGATARAHGAGRT